MSVLLTWNNLPDSVYFSSLACFIRTVRVLYTSICLTTSGGLSWAYILISFILINLLFDM